MADTKTIHLTKEEWEDLQHVVRWGLSFAIKRDGLTIRLMVPPGVPGDVALTAKDDVAAAGLVL